MRCATSYWLYITLRRLGHDGEAMLLLEPIRRDMEILENHAYHRLLLAFRGDIDIAEVITAMDGADELNDTTTAYGVAAWFLMNGEEADGVERCRAIVDGGGPWAASGFSAAEAEVARHR